MTKVIFRKYKDGDVLAIFPEIPGDHNYETCGSYQHIGQHGPCTPFWAIQSTKPCPIPESEPLRTELESIGYELNIIERYRYMHYQKRVKEIKRMECV